MAKTDTPPPRLAELLRYDPDTGHFHHLTATRGRGGAIRIGDIAGTDSYGYVSLNIDKIIYRAHRVAWYVMTGDWLSSSQDIDHIDTNRSNNSWGNLRLATRSQNNVNVSRHRADNTTGKRGVYQRSDRTAWFARITVRGKIIHLGQYPTIDGAVEARKAAELRYFGHLCGT